MAAAAGTSTWVWMSMVGYVGLAAVVGSHFGPSSGHHSAGRSSGVDGGERVVTDRNIFSPSSP
jgi:hypothetical protein